MTKHLDVLSDAGFTEPDRPHGFGPSFRPTQEAMEELKRYEHFWTISLDRLLAARDDREAAAPDIVRRIKAPPARSMRDHQA